MAGRVIGVEIEACRRRHFLRRRGFEIRDLALVDQLRRRYAPRDRTPIDESMYLVLAQRLAEPVAS